MSVSDWSSAMPIWVQVAIPAIGRSWRGIVRLSSTTSPRFRPNRSRRTPSLRHERPMALGYRRPPVMPMDDVQYLVWPEVRPPEAIDQVLQNLWPGREHIDGLGNDHSWCWCS